MVRLWIEMINRAGIDALASKPRARLCSRILDYDKSRYQVESGKEGFAQLVVAGCNAPEVFDLVEEALDKVAMAVEFLVVMELFTPGANRRITGWIPS